MKLSLCLSAFLAISIYWNFSLWNQDVRLSGDLDKPAPPIAKKLTALVDGVRADLELRVERLLDKGLSKEHATAAVIPGLNQRLRDRYMSRKDPIDLVRTGMRANGERRDLLKELGAGDFNENVFNPYRIRMRHEFDPPEAKTGTLKQRDSGRGESTSSGGSGGLRPGGRGVHDVLSQIGGVSLTRDEKADLVEISQAHHNDPEARAAALGEAFDAETAAQLLRCFEPGYQKAYQRATSVNDDMATRVRFANALHQYVLDRNHPQRHERLLEALGEDGAEIVRAARW